MSDLVKRLRSGEPCGDDKCRTMTESSGCLCSAAADRIEELEAECRAHEGNARENYNRLMAAEAKLAMARNDALEDAALMAGRKMEHYAELTYSPNHDKIQNAAKTYCAGEIAAGIRALKSTSQT